MATLNVLASFNDIGGVAGLATDAAGDLFGTTGGGNANSAGTVFEITKTSNTYGPPTTLASFNSANDANSSTNGAVPGGLTTDAAGDLFGTTSFGGTGYDGTSFSGDGTVFEIAKTGNTYSAPTILASFNGTDGENPTGSLTTDAAGDLFGTTSFGGTGYDGTSFSGDGTVFEIAKTGNTYSAPTTLVSFNGTDGENPDSSLTTDAAGDLFGTTSYGGTGGFGLVFEIAKTGNTFSAPITLASSNSDDTASPLGSLTTDAAGDLFGITAEGVTPEDVTVDSTVFEIAKTGKTYNAPITLASFNGPNGADPTAGTPTAGTLIADAAGDLFGTTYGGGTRGLGAMFEIAKTGNVYSAPVTLASFNGANGDYPTALTSDAAGDLFGTTFLGGADGGGTVFEITDSGFVVSHPGSAGTCPVHVLKTIIYTGGVLPISSPGEDEEVIIKASGPLSLPSNATVVINTANSAVLFGGGAPDETIRSGNGNLTFFTDGGSGIITTGDGNNRIVQSGSGSWNINTGGGTNEILIAGGNNTVAAGTGSNTILLSGGNNLVNSTGNDVIQAVAGNDTIVASGTNAVQVEGVKASLTFIGGAGPATVLGGQGSATIFATSGGDFRGGTTGNNYIMGGDGPTTITGGGNGDVLYANGSGPTQIFAASGNETLDASLSTGNDTLTAGSGSNQLTGGFGSDTLVGGNGASTMQGGAGNDTFEFISGLASKSLIVGFSAIDGDQIKLVGYGANEVDYATSHEQVSAAGTAVTLSDSTKIVFSNVTDVTKTSFF